MGKENILKEILAKLNEKQVRLVAVSKTKSVEDILRVYNQGQRVFGENKAQELKEKYEQLPKDIEWHLIGHLQTNKVKYIAPFVALIHAVDSLKLLQEINKQALKNNRIIDCLFQIYIAKEETKFGLSEKELKEILESSEFKHLENIRMCGLMGIATLTEDETLIRNEFQSLKATFNKTKEKYFPDSDYFKEISMGMSGDYEIAIEEGSTLVRIGSLIFGERN